jgi:hypothetical protein
MPQPHQEANDASIFIQLLSDAGNMPVTLGNCRRKVLAASKKTGTGERSEGLDQFATFKIGGGRRQPETHGYLRPSQAKKRTKNAQAPTAPPAGDSTRREIPKVRKQTESLG